MSSRFLALGAVLVGCLPFATGCVAEDRTQNEPREQFTGSQGQAIKGGYDDVDDTAVVGIYDDLSGGLCSGSLIAPNVVLTARHCVAPVLNESAQGGVLCGQTTFGTNHKPKYFYVTTKPSFTQNGSDYHGVVEVLTPPVDSKFCGNDEAILILDSNIDPSEAVPLTPRVDVELVANEEYYAIGYGATNDSGGGAGKRRRRDTLFIDCVADDCPHAYVKPTEWVGDQGICSGDSGGPALDLKHRVVGVTSRGAVNCEDPVYGYVFSWAQWIKDTTLYAASVGGYAAPPWATGWPTDPEYSMPIGDACTQPPECLSGRCLNDGVASYCTRLCNEIAPCPEGYSCDAGDLGVCVQDHAAAPPPKKKASNPATGETVSCALGQNPDPTKPIPWIFGAGALGAIALLRRRSRR